MSRTAAKGPAKGKRSMTRPIIYLAATILVFVVYFLHPPVGDGPSMKVVIDSDGLVYRYISEDSGSYKVGAQDIISIDKSGAKVETWSAARGKGVVFMTDYGSADVKKSPRESSKTISHLNYEKGFVPDSYRCLGYTRKGWYKVETPEGIGYVYKDYVFWDAVDSF